MLHSHSHNPGVPGSHLHGVILDRGRGATGHSFPSPLGRQFRDIFPKCPRSPRAVKHPSSVAAVNLIKQLLLVPPGPHP